MMKPSQDDEVEAVRKMVASYDEALVRDRGVIFGTQRRTIDEP